MKTKPIIHPDLDPYEIILLLWLMEIYIVKRLRKYERSKFILKQIASNYGSEKQTVCFQLWGSNLVFAFIKVGQAQIFGCVCLKRKCIV